MYVRKFEADTLDEALKAIKREMGPDAIILKTVNNKGIKGAFKKKRIEITAAISEQNYVKKAKVDHVLSDNDKESFYEDNASSIKKMIDGHSSNTPKGGGMNAGGYGGLGLNRSVSTIKKEEDVEAPRSSGLDAFLSEPSESPAQPSRGPAITPSEEQNLSSFMQEDDDDLSEELLRAASAHYQAEQKAAEEVVAAPRPEPVRPRPEVQAPVEQVASVPNKKVEDLEKRLYELSKQVKEIQRREPVGVYQLRTTLRSLDISEKYIQTLIRKSAFDLSDDEAQNSDAVFEYALREMLTEIKTDMPHFSKVDDSENPVITVLMSDMSSGQTSMMLKLGALKKDAVLIQNSRKNQEENTEFYEKLFGIKIIKANGAAEVVSTCRKALEERRSVIVDYNCQSGEINETKKFVDGLRRSFNDVEVLVSLSAIHSEMYNRKVVSLYKGLADGLVVSHLDQCLNFGALFNLSESFKELPYKFYGTGNVVPDDLEAATAERILAGIFHL